MARPSLINDLLAYWKLDEASGDRADSYGSYDLTNTSVASAAGKIGRCATFTGVNQELTYADALFSARSALSLSFWYVQNSANDAFTFITSGDAAEVYAHCSADGISTGKNTPTFGGQTWNVRATGALTAGQWDHIVIVYDGTASTKVKIYVNGVDQTVSSSGTVPSVLPTHTGSFHLGYYFAQYSDGNLDELGVWTRALTASEVSDLYGGGAGLPYPLGWSVNGLKYERLVQEDLNVGTDAAWVTAPGGGELRATQVGLHSVARGQKAYTKTWAPGAITAGSYAATTISVPDATVGDFVMASHDKMLTNDLRITGNVYASDMVSVVVHNPTSASITPASGTLSVLVFPAIGVNNDPDVADIYGNVTYDSGTPWPSAPVTLNMDGLPYDTTTADGSGYYIFSDVPAGSAEVIVDGDPGPGPRYGTNSGTHTPPADTSLDVDAVGA